MECSMIHKYFQTVETLLQADKVPKDYGTGDVLTRADLRFLQEVFRTPDSNAVALSRQLGITRGAVTQTGNRLEERGFLERYAQQGNKKERYYRLTPAGEAVRVAHKKYHDEANRQICQYLRTLSLKDKETISAFLDKLAELPVCEFECYYDCTRQSKKEL